MQTTVLVISLLFTIASSAQAATITLDWGAPDLRSDVLIPSVQNIHARVIRAIPGNFRSIATEWVIPNVTIADIGRTWTLTAANAASNGFDWSILQTAALNFDSLLYSTSNHWGVEFGTLSFPGRVSANRFYGQLYDINGNPSQLRPRFTTVDRIEIKLEEFYTVPIGSIIRFRSTLTGEGTFVPVHEPASWLMLCVGLATIRVRR